MSTAWVRGKTDGDSRNEEKEEEELGELYQNSIHSINNLGNEVDEDNVDIFFMDSYSSSSEAAVVCQTKFRV